MSRRADEEGFDTPEEAAAVGGSKALAVYYAPGGNVAAVLLANEDLSAAVAVCRRGRRRWRHVGGGLGASGYATATPEYVAIADCVPEEAVRVVIEYRGIEHEVPVVGGRFAFAAPGLPEGPRPSRWPRAIRWVDATGVDRAILPRQDGWPDDDALTGLSSGAFSVATSYGITTIRCGHRPR